ncbi:hypothetical protein CFP65_3818 [Kitasatospora sp. MMS16-BH015]|uniref:S53 family peptidase n=1 Tax=Kitasatospora sp. MMS16-BH015 TaxID=2018025 RepID=UPI000CA2D9A1|nr:S53 family peptidase [Kitasatospora sp. MMS16-BH015]AUG78598.1 hypothetical protein CFP65_3818 [Kitasatospora sp. MMS16-BH015]
MLDPSGPQRTPRARGPLGRATTLAAITVALVAGAGTPNALAAPTTSLAPQRLSGDLGQLPADAVKTAAPAGDTPLDLSVTLAMRDEAGAQALAAAMTDPSSAEYHHFLATGEFAKRFGADAATVAKVTQALKDAGLQPGALGADGLTLPVHTTVAGAKKAFDVDFAGYRLGDGTSAFRNTEAPALRGDVVGSVAAITGMNSTAKPHAHHKGAQDLATVPAAKYSSNASAAAAYPQLCQSVKDYYAGKGRIDGRDYFSPASLANAYGLNGLSDGGAGTTVAIFSLESYSAPALKTYQDCVGTNATVNTVLVNAGNPAPADPAKEIGLEAALDIDTVVGLAPKAKVLFYQGKDAAQATDADVINTYRQIVTDNQADVISTSWGSCDYVNDRNTLKAESNVFLQGALQGISMVAASGDDGSTDCTRSTNDPVAQKHLSADDPSSQPFVTGVGGTTLSASGETVWNHDHGASGGGESTFWALPNGGYQNGFKAPGFDNSRCELHDATHLCRQSPDVAADADPATGYIVAVGAGQWMRIGGTSGAAPLWAAVTAHVDSTPTCTGRVGLLNTPLYQAARTGRSPLNDVTVGNNDVDNQQGGLYAAAAGYDMATGLGTPKGAELVSTLCMPAATYQPVTPSRILDTRNGTGRGQVAGLHSVDLQVTGKAGVPSTNVTAVVLNTTVVDTAAAGYLTAYPAATKRPLSSNLNWTQGGVVPNLVTVPVSADGKITLFNGSWGASDFVADVAGYYTTDGSGAQLAPLAPTRLLDTRRPKATLAGKTGTSLQVTGRAGVPAGATAAVLNVTVADTASSGYLTVSPSGIARPLASNLNWVPGQVVPNAVIVPIGADGKIDIFNGGLGSTDVVVDIAGYFSPKATGGKFQAVKPARQLDTRQGHGALTNGKVTPLALSVPANATSVTLNVTVTNTTSPGYLTAWADGSTRPLASNLNWVQGNTIANLVTVPVHNGKVDLVVSGWGQADVVVDLFGYYSN